MLDPLFPPKTPAFPLIDMRNGVPARQAAPHPENVLPPNGRRARVAVVCVLAAVLAVVLAAGCGASEPAPGAAGGTRAKGGEITVGLAANPDVLDPSLAAGLESREVLTHICESLYTLGPDNKPKPQLATEPLQWSKDGLKITIKL